MNWLKSLGTIAIGSSIIMFAITFSQILGMSLNLSVMWYWIFQIYFMTMWAITIFIAFTKIIE